MAFPEELLRFQLLNTFNDAQREGLRRALVSDPDARVRHFERGAKVCCKGDFELDLCFILNGSVDLMDDLASSGWSRVATLRTGQFFGELGAIGGLPRTTDVVAAEPCDIFYVPRHALKFFEINSDARRLLADRYRERAVRVAAQELDLFIQAPPGLIDDLIPHCEIERYDLSDITIVKQGEPGDALYIVRDGFVKVVHELPDGNHRVLAYLRGGEYFGEMALLGAETRYASVLTAGRCELIRLRREDFAQLCKMRPEVEASVRAVISRRREEEQRITPEISELLERSGQLGLVQADALLVMDLDLCVKCDNCVTACETLHGSSRLIRNGIHVDKYLVPSACRHCEDPKCMNSCPTGAIKRRAGGEIYFQYDMCIGCGNCAIACPYDNIAMIDTATFDFAQARKSRVAGREVFRPYPIAAHDAPPGLWRRLFKSAPRAAALPPPQPAPGPPHVPPPAFPIKCDLCDGLPFMGCVHNCPTGAAIRLDPAQLFASVGAVTSGSRVQRALGSGDGEAQPASSDEVVESTRPAGQWRLPHGVVPAAVAAVAVVVIHTATGGVARTLGPYRTGVGTLALFAAAALYTVRKRTLWASVRYLRATEIMPAPLRRWIVATDRLETWRRVHLAIGVLAALPLWWHLQSGRMNAVEALLAAAVVLMLASGMFCVIVQDLLPRRSRLEGDHFVRIEDVDAAINAIYVEAEEKILGRSEDLIRAYLANIRPILSTPQPGWRMLRALVIGADSAVPALEAARAQAPNAANDAATYAEVLKLAEAKVRLDHNEFDLWLSTAWLRVHIGLVIFAGLLITFHVLTVLYFVGI